MAHNLKGIRKIKVLPPPREDILRWSQQVIEETRRQDAKWGPQTHAPSTWLGILVEEVGECATEMNLMHFDKKDSRNLEIELIQVAAVALQMIDDLRQIRHIDIP